MANFQTHLNGGIVASAATTLSLHMAGLIQSGQTVPIFAMGVIGSLLPDIDSDTSKPVNALFSVLGAGLAFAMTLPLTGRFLPLELAGIWVGVYLCVRYGFFEIFARFTVHRGVWHSWLGIAASALAATNLVYWSWGQSPDLAWVAGFVVGIGYLTHLLLDELFSVDLFNAKVKRSFGTALKPFSLNSPMSSLGMLVVVGVLVWLAPSPDPLLARIDTQQFLQVEVIRGQLGSGLQRSLAQLGDWWSQLARLLDLG
ncbi:metal-dependent hydrolase [Thiorhodococcus mannitoliphagus]|uniref:Metal-dependent hydrolase n=1 Tax=Thiorhodococcus mannitoliphagus TaxID=329406 RepID=A0A6P1DWI3_9GAMM|nr:metal-dependent hydrolase [Thiorhodococcus mannitoliphagus]NEX22677.1 metal-dependent hydrolase [Thiorhodococcus mannitoliphagus]